MDRVDSEPTGPLMILQETDTCDRQQQVSPVDHFSLKDL